MSKKTAIGKFLVETYEVIPVVPRPGFTSQILVSFHGKVVSATA